MENGREQWRKHACIRQRTFTRVKPFNIPYRDRTRALAVHGFSRDRKHVPFDLSNRHVAPTCGKQRAAHSQPSVPPQPTVGAKDEEQTGRIGVTR
jgi:hypothetical protein